MITLYKILGVEESATSEQIKDAYRAMAMKWHPDRNPNNRLEAEEKFKEIGAAYKVLSDAEQRREYNDWLNQHRQDVSQDTFVNTFSDLDAEQMFYDSMLDLAIELARRGYELAQIIKVLKTLDCPDAVARVAVLNAIKIVKNVSANAGNTAKTASPEKQAQPKAIKSIEEASWVDIEAYYAAVIGGVYAVDRMDETEYQQHYAVHSKQMKVYLNSVVLIILGGTFGALFKKPEIGALFSGICVLVILGVAIWRMFTNNSKFNREKTMRYYLTAFECYHNARPMPFKLKSWNIWAYLFNFSWFTYRKMHGLALASIAIYGVLVLGQFLFENSNPQLSLILGLSQLVYFISLGAIANKRYFKYAQKQIKTVLQLSRDRATAELRNLGGVNSWSWILIFLILIMLEMPAYLKYEELRKENEAAIAAQMQADEAARIRAEQQAQAEAQTQANALEAKRMDALITELEAKYPELDANSPHFNQKITDEVLSRQKAYIDQGQPPSNALRMAIDDMTRPASPDASVTY